MFPFFRLSKCQSNNNGLGLVEVLVAAGLLGTLALFGGQLLTNQVRGLKTVEQKSDTNDLYHEMQAFFRDPANCKKNFLNKNIGSTTTFSNLYDATNNIRYKKSQRWGMSGITINDIIFGGSVLDSGGTAIANHTKLAVTITQRQLSGQIKNYTFNVVLVASTNASNQLLSCYAIGGQDQLWMRVAGGSNIYYRDGSTTAHVGIGTNAPLAKLDVLSSGGTDLDNLALNIKKNYDGGGANVLTAKIVGVDAGVGETGLHITRKGSDSMYGSNHFVWQAVANGNPIMTQNYSGNVGIGTATPQAKLDVNGDIRIGTSAANCKAANKGTMRYNTSSNKMEFCNGTDWTEIGTCTENSQYVSEECDDQLSCSITLPEKGTWMVKAMAVFHEHTWYERRLVISDVGGGANATTQVVDIAPKHGDQEGTGYVFMMGSRTITVSGNSGTVTANINYNNPKSNSWNGYRIIVEAHKN